MTDWFTKNAAKQKEEDTVKLTNRFAKTAKRDDEEVEEIFPNLDELIETDQIAKSNTKRITFKKVAKDSQKKVKELRKIKEGKLSVYAAEKLQTNLNLVESMAERTYT